MVKIDYLWKFFLKNKVFRNSNLILFLGREFKLTKYALGINFSSRGFLELYQPGKSFTHELYA